MEDRYLFKAKRIDNGEWAQGYLFDDGFENGKIFIGGLVIEKYNGTACDEWNVTGIDFYEVDPSTICQCTGLKDKNGNLIWENDIVKRNFYLYSSEAKYEERENCGIVKYDKEYARFGYQCSVFAMLSESKKHDTIEVIGNIFDNKELLESEEI